MLQYLKLAPWFLFGLALAGVLLLRTEVSDLESEVEKQTQAAQSAQTRAESAETQIKTLNQSLKDQKERNDETQAKLDEAESDQQSAEDAGARLRRELARMRNAKSSSDSCPAGQAPSAVTAVTSAEGSRAVLTDLLSQCSERREELAQFADKSRIAHASCIGDYRAAERLIEQLINRPSDK